MTWAYAVGFKAPRGRRIRWILTPSQDVCEASRLAREFMAQRHPGSPQLEYGHSKVSGP